MSEADQDINKALADKNHPDVPEHIGVLSDRDIRKEIAAGNIILHDPERDCQGNIQNCSVDITLGPYYYRNEEQLPCLNPWNSQHIREYWGEVKSASIIDSEINPIGSECIAKDMGLKIGDKYIYLSPGETILAHTREFIGGLNHITTMVRARSSMGRCGVTICRDSGWGDIGFYNRWNLQVTNNSTSPIVLPVGARIGQIIFFYTGIPDKVYSGKYQTGNNLKEIVEKWDPSMLLPKAYQDK